MMLARWLNSAPTWQSGGGRDLGNLAASSSVLAQQPPIAGGKTLQRQPEGLTRAARPISPFALSSTMSIVGATCWSFAASSGSGRRSRGTRVGSFTQRLREERDVTPPVRRVGHDRDGLVDGQPIAMDEHLEMDGVVADLASAFGRPPAAPGLGALVAEQARGDGAVEVRKVPFPLCWRSTA